ncbi:MAG TPA: NAD(P)-binding oxidoreductase [Candidatus Sulfotelmatobacter sp.]|nr:NAD(P)-binding oxidoreductase [Candidatus Sulfotelmatobacter sp.]
MKILVLGATGKTGQHVIEKTLAQGHQVTAFVRSPKKLHASKKVHVIVGDARNKVDLQKAIKGQDAVLSTLGSVKINDDVILKTTQALIAAATQSGVKRVIMLSSFLVRPNYKPNFLGKLVGGVMKGMILDKQSGENLLKSSNLDWTIVYATMLDKIKPGGKVRLVGDNETVSMSNGIARADVADFMIKELTTSEDIHKSVLITVT